MSDMKIGPTPPTMRDEATKTGHLGESAIIHPTTPSDGSQFGTYISFVGGRHQPVVLGAHRGQTEVRRIDRLQSLASDLLDREILVTHLFDYKGRLFANLEMRVTRSVANRVKRAWERAGEHAVDGYYCFGAFVRGKDDDEFVWFMDELGDLTALLGGHKNG